MKKSIVSILILCGVLSANCSSNNDDTVTCTDTGLMWQDNVEVNSNSRNWQNAIKYCEDLTLAGYTNWRLPNRNELKSIVDYTKPNPVIKSGFTNTSSYSFWTSTTFASNTSNAWYVYFYYGDGYWVDKSYSCYVRCVRAGQ